MKFGKLILRKIVAARPVGSVPATGFWSNHETVGDLMGEVSARCIEALSATTSSMEGGTLQRQQTTVMKEQRRDNLICCCELPTNKAIKENSRNYSV